MYLYHFLADEKKHVFNLSDYSGGTAGSFIANRLSVSSNASVLVLEKDRVNAGLI